ncbi:MAG: NUDIX hydrolase [bacterium]|nr:NUDIX hydrolase [bacterium]
MKKNPWKKLDSRMVYTTPWISVREDRVIRPDGKEGKYSVIEMGHDVYIVAMDDQERFCLIGQHRYPTGSYSWELPGGNTDGEDIIEAAKRELWEEAGLKARQWQEIGTYEEMNGTTDCVMHVILARELQLTEDNKMAEEAIDNAKKVTIEQALEMIKTGEIVCALTTAAILKTALILEKKI